jgi:primosomal protein N' (replication factor Y) (superfamily II helicase)
MYEAALRADALQLDDAMAFLGDAVATAPPDRDNITVYDPAPASMVRLADRERAQLIVQCPSRPLLQRFLRGWSETLFARTSGSVRWHFDVDPVEF